MSRNMRWRCPDCQLSLLAPSRLRRKDVRRYCLPCSSKAGVLIERKAPVLEQRRKDKKIARQERARVARVLKSQAFRNELDFRAVLCGIQVLKWMRDRGLAWPSRLRTRKTIGPGPLVRRGEHFYFRSGDWEDEHDVYAQALVMGVYLSRFWNESLTKSAQRVYLRDQADALLCVRPRLDSMAKAPVEIAALLRKRAAAKTLSGVTERVA